ncbi:MAG: hypothetical protein M3P04_07230 [Actinomycetota bacterium]|nr:hypothetical protein [Actinomycetota bacterium]
MTTTTSRVVKAAAHRQAFVAGLLLSLGLTGCGGGGSAEAKGAASEATPSRLSMPSGDAELVAGTYLAPKDESSAFEYSITFPAGWHLQAGNEYQLHEDAPGGVGILPFLVDEIYADACLGDRAGVTKVGPRPQDLIDALLAQVGPAKSSPVQTTFGGYPATRIDLRVPQSLQAKDCFLGPGTGVQLWQSPQHRYNVLGPQGMASVYVVDVDGQRQVFSVQYDPAHISDDDRVELQKILDSIRIQR